MYLKRIKLRNFKSFAGTTEIPFQPGFTGVAGPNGMGKSNISDAILFVLGPTSSKALRADRLTHLFFNGGAAKKPSSECEVSLVFDNADRVLPVDSEEVELTRYVKLAPNDSNGYYSYFYVNGRRSTQGEIDGLLAQGRLSGDGYNLVQQGDVNRIVSMGPMPRRGLVERLAGIAQYDEELSRAEAKRTDLETNLGRIGTLLTEIRQHLSGLENQRLQAIQYKEFQDQKRRAEARLAQAGVLLARQEVTTCEAHAKELASALDVLRTDAARLEAERDRSATELERLDAEIARQSGPEAAKLKADFDEKRLALARLDDAVKRANEDSEEFAHRSQELTGQVRAAEKEVTRLEKLEVDLARQLKELNRKLETNRKSMDSESGDVSKESSGLAEARRSIADLEKGQVAHEERWKSSITSLEGAKARLESAERDQAIAEDDRRDRELEVRDAELQARPNRGEKSGKDSATELNERLQQLRGREKGLAGDRERLAQEVLELNRRYMALDARLKARADTSRGPSNLAAVDFLLSRRNLGQLPGVRGTVEELSQIPDEHRVALTIAGGNRFQALVVESDQVAEECIKLLREERRGRATFLPLNKILPGRPRGKSLLVAQSDGSRGFAMDLVKFDEELRAAFWYVFGETVVMSDLASARAQMGGVRLVTSQGDLIEATGAITGGYIDTSAKARGSDNPVELRRLADELREKNTQQAAARDELKSLEEKIRAIVEQLAQKTADDHARSKAQAGLDQQLDAARQRLKETIDRVRKLTVVREDAEKEITRLQAETTKCSEELAAIKDRLATIREEFQARLPTSVAARIKELQNASESLRNEQVSLTGQLESARASLVAAREQLTRQRSDLEEAAQLISDKAKEIAKFSKDRDTVKAALETVQAVETRQSKASQELSEKRRKLETSRLSLVDKLARSQEALSTKSAMQHDAEVRLTTARAHLAEVEQALKELPAPSPNEKPQSVDELRRAILAFQAQLDALGSVNLRAVEEYDGEKKRLEEFDSEVRRLEEEKKELLDLVGTIEGKKKEKLSTVVASVNVGFQQLYRELSGGGEGEIALESPEDPLKGGLLIRARPVGKTVQRLEQLSGGEKSLASLAFVFALQRHDPSPLYVFDEVDQSLDGVNAENVGRLLRRNAERAQFIVISLRKVSLKCAHQLFGITMHGDGCSRVVGLNLDEIVDVEERDRATEKPVMVEAA